LARSWADGLDGLLGHLTLLTPGAIGHLGIYIWAPRKINNTLDSGMITIMIF
jgi:hypothetical protein